MSSCYWIMASWQRNILLKLSKCFTAAKKIKIFALCYTDSNEIHQFWRMLKKYWNDGKDFAILVFDKNPTHLLAKHYSNPTNHENSWETEIKLGIHIKITTHSLISATACHTQSAHPLPFPFPLLFPFPLPLPLLLTLHLSNPYELFNVERPSFVE